MRRSHFFAAAIVFLFLSQAPAWASDASENTPNGANLEITSIPLERPFGSQALQQFDQEKKLLENVRGWNHTASLLHEAGLSAKFINELFNDSRMPKVSPIYFRVAPKESRYQYRKHNSSRARKNALAFYKHNGQFFRAAMDRYSVPESVLLAILQVETKCGGYTGKSRIFYRLARLVEASSPGNINKNFKRQRRGDSSLRLKQVEQRAIVLRKTFLPHVLATIEVAKAQQLHPLDLKGSPAGALGLPQFLPANYFTYGIDANNDQEIDLFSPADAIFSVANYLAAHGWKTTSLSPREKHNVIWHYNHSDAYIETVLGLAKDLEPDIAKHRKTLTEPVVDTTPARLQQAANKKALQRGRLSRHWPKAAALPDSASFDDSMQPENSDWQTESIW